MICYNCKHNIADSLTECPVCKAPLPKHPQEPYDDNPMITTKIPKKNKIIMLIIGGIAIIGCVVVAIVK